MWFALHFTRALCYCHRVGGRRASSSSSSRTRVRLSIQSPLSQVCLYWCPADYLHIGVHPQSPSTLRIMFPGKTNHFIHSIFFRILSSYRTSTLFILGTWVGYSTALHRLWRFFIVNSLYSTRVLEQKQLSRVRVRLRLRLRLEMPSGSLDLFDVLRAYSHA